MKQQKRYAKTAFSDRSNGCWSSLLITVVAAAPDSNRIPFSLNVLFAQSTAFQTVFRYSIVIIIQGSFLVVNDAFDDFHRIADAVLTGAQDISRIEALEL